MTVGIICTFSSLSCSPSVPASKQQKEGEYDLEQQPRSAAPCAFSLHGRRLRHAARRRRSSLQALQSPPPSHAQRLRHDDRAGGLAVQPGASSRAVVPPRKPRLLAGSAALPPCRVTRSTAWSTACAARWDRCSSSLRCGISRRWCCRRSRRHASSSAFCSPWCSWATKSRGDR